MRAIKQPSEKVTFRYQFGADVGETGSVASIVGVPTSVARNGGANMTLSGAASIDGNDVLVSWQGGAAGESYLTTVKVLDAGGNQHERDGEIEVVEVGFVVPAGIASRYLTAEEYVARYGQAETVRLTDEDKTGVVDTARLDAALKDATEEADGYIGVRYSTPLVSTPRLVKSIVGALARERLHKTRPTPEVTAAADRARTQLRDISAGRMTLPVEVGDTEPVIGGNLYSTTSGDGSSSFKDAVASFNVGSPYPVANWRR